MRTSLAFLLLPALCVLAGGESLADPTSTVVRVTRPTVIGFFPPVSQAELNDYSTGASSGVDHVQFALSDAAKCLKEIKPVVRFVFASTVVLEVRGKRTTINIPSDWKHSYGAILAVPNRAPRVVHAELGPSALVVTLPQAAEEYFGVKACHVSL